MTKATKWVLWGVSMFILICIILTVVSLNLKEQFGIKNADIDRKIYEQSKSYVHGKLQDLAKYYDEYQQADLQDKGAIRNLIQINFVEFEVKHIKNNKLKTFFIEMRGY